MTGRPRLFVLNLVCGAVVLTACASPQSEETRRTVERFEAALETDAPTACTLLAPATRREVEREGPCPQALGELDLHQGGAIGDIEVAGHSAAVRMSGDTVFLALFDDGWRVVAAGCTAESDDVATPLECILKGG